MLAIQVLKQRADGRQCPIDRNLLREASSAAYSYPPNYALIEVITAGTLIAQQAPAGECDEMGDEELAVEAVALSRQEVEARVQEEIIRQMAAEKVQYERRQEEKKKQIELAWEVLRKSEIQAFLTTIGDDLVEKARAVLASALEL